MCVCDSVCVCMQCLGAVVNEKEHTLNIAWPT